MLLLRSEVMMSPRIPRPLALLLAVGTLAACSGDGTDGTDDTDAPLDARIYRPEDFAGMCPFGVVPQETEEQAAFRRGFIEAVNEVRAVGGTCAGPSGDTEFGELVPTEVSPEVTFALYCALQREGSSPDAANVQQGFVEVMTELGESDARPPSLGSINQHGAPEDPPAAVLSALMTAATPLSSSTCDYLVAGRGITRSGVAYHRGIVLWGGVN